jgi:catechol 2,3-dioxygenase-like lactoylglutathione lyase family enzyme
MTSPADSDSTSIRPTALDHVALWVADREPLANFVCDHLGMHVIEQTDKFTLVGSDARRGKLTLFDAEGPRDVGALERVVFRVSNLDEAVGRLPDGLDVEQLAPGVVGFEGPEGLRLGLTDDYGKPEVEYDLDHVVLKVRDPGATFEALTHLGFDAEDDKLVIADKYVQLVGDGTPEGDNPLLNHIAVLVDSAEAIHSEALARGLDVQDFVDAPNTLAVFLWGPDRIRLEYVEHKPSFSLV